MTRLVAAELRKVWRSRFFLVALAALLGGQPVSFVGGHKARLQRFHPGGLSRAVRRHCGHGYAADG